MTRKLPTLTLRVSHKMMEEILAQEDQLILLPNKPMTLRLKQTYSIHGLKRYYNSLKNKPQFWDYCYIGFLMDCTTKEHYRFSFRQVDEAPGPTYTIKPLTRIRRKPSKSSL